MKTKKNLVKTMLMSILTAGTFGMGMTACSDDLNEFGTAATETAVAGSDLMNLEQHSYTVPVEIQSEGAWKVDFRFADDNRHFCYALPAEGVGPQTIKLCVLDNWADERNVAEMVITDMANPANSQTIQLGQKCNLDNAGMTRGNGAGAPVLVGDIVYGVGYGYNINMQPGLDAVSHSPIIAIEKVKTAGIGQGRCTKGVNTDLRITTHTGSTIDEVARSLETSASIKGSFAGFKAEAGASFNHEDVTKNECYFALGVVDAAVTSTYLDGINELNARKYMTDDAMSAIDGNGSTDPANFLKVIKAYGTHLLLEAPLGGRLRYAITVDKKFVSSKEDMKLWANASYKNTFVEADAKMSAEQKKSHQMTDEKGSIRVSALGGSLDAALAINAADNNENVSNWLKSLKMDDNGASNMVVVGTNGHYTFKTIPIWELVDSKYPERQQKLREYIESGMAEYEMNPTTNVVKTGEMAKMSIPTFTDNADNPSTLVKEVYMHNKVVAQICNEYIPDLDPNGRVTVVYPVIDGKPAYTNGLFTGSADYAPMYVSWNDNGTPTFTRIDGAQKGSIDTVYVRDTKIFTKQYNKNMVELSEIIDSKVRDKKLEGAIRYTGLSIEMSNTKETGWRDVKYSYPLVKIGTKLWTRMDYAAEIKGDCHKKYLTDEDNNKPQITNYTLCSYYTNLQAANGNNIPMGWKVANSKDYQAVKNLLSSGNYKTPGKRLFNSKQSGYNAIARGWYNWKTVKEVDCSNPFWVSEKKHDEYKYLNPTDQMEYMTSDNCHIRVKTDGTFDIEKWGNSVLYCMAVRLVAE